MEARPVIGPPAEPLVLVVDDEDMIRSLVRSVLESIGCRVVEADCARAALEQADETALPIDLLVSDVRMPGPSGLELARILRERKPELPVVFVSGYPGESPVNCSPTPITEYLAKPFSLPVFVATVRRLLLSATTTE
jgi:two-component system cell cycle sensor histidine kinase/response regulator CckA